MKTDSRPQTPIQALRQYMDIMLGAGIVVGQAAPLYSQAQVWGWQARPYIVTIVVGYVLIAPIEITVLQHLALPPYEYLHILDACRWPKEPQPVRRTPEEAYKDAVKLSYCSIPLSGAGFNRHWPLTEKQAFEILSHLKHKLAEASASLEQWEVTDTLEDIAKV